MDNPNHATLYLGNKAENVSLARVLVAAFISPLEPTLDILSDIQTAVSEAVTNAIIHGYANLPDTHEVCMELLLTGRTLQIKITDQGVGIDNIEDARQPLFTTKPELERSGLGFTVMEGFMDSVEVESTPGRGTCVVMQKNIPIATERPA